MPRRRSVQSLRIINIQPDDMARIDDLTALAEDPNKFQGTQKLAKWLYVEPAKGMDSEKVGAHREWFGRNWVDPRDPPTYLSLLLDAFRDTTIIMLSVACAVQAVFAFLIEQTTSSYIEVAALFGTILIVTNVAAWMDWQKGQRFYDLNYTVANPPVDVFRNGKRQSIEHRDVVVGDVLFLGVGDIPCADGVLIEGADIRTDESSLTGESVLISKCASGKGVASFVWSGTKVLEGSGKMLVIAVGENSQAGRISTLVESAASEEDQMTVLQAKLHRMALQIGKAGMIVASLCFAVMFLKFAFSTYVIHKVGQNCYDLTYQPFPEQTFATMQFECDFQQTRAANETSYCGQGLPQCPLGMPAAPCVAYFSDDTTDHCPTTSAIVCNDLVTACQPAATASLFTCDLYVNDGASDAAGQLIRRAVAETTEGTTVRFLSKGKQGCGWNFTHLLSILDFVVAAITILIVAIPEGLPLAVILSLSYTVLRLERDNNLVKHLAACETMGSATTICSDKTGTLTQNRMSVVRAFFAGNFVDIRPGTTAEKDPENICMGALAKAIAVNSEADVEWDSEGNILSEFGNKTDCALVGFVRWLGFSHKRLRNQKNNFVVVDGVRRFGVKRIPFHSKTKRSAVVVPIGGVSKSDDSDKPGPKGYRLFVKGASEVVLSLCKEQLSKDGEVVDLTAEQAEKIRTDVIDDMARNAMRTICVAYRDFMGSTPPDWEALVDEKGMVRCVEQELCFLGAVGIEDPIRPDVPKAIAACNRAGIDVRMVTGDNLDTAIAIAKQCNIISDEHVDQHTGSLKPNVAMTGPDFRKRVLDHYAEDGKPKIDMEAFDELWPELRVLARSSPEDKFTLVSGLNQSQLWSSSDAAKDFGIYPDRQVIAVTGDGTNDAPALKRADVGFAMGKTGTSVAKDAADIILTDDNFSDIVKACLWGRNVYDSVSKFLQFQLTVNVVACTMAVIGAVAFNESPLKAVQMPEEGSSSYCRDDIQSLNGQRVVGFEHLRGIIFNIPRNARVVDLTYTPYRQSSKPNFQTTSKLNTTGAVQINSSWATSKTGVDDSASSSIFPESRPQSPQSTEAKLDESRVFSYRVQNLPHF